MQERFNQDKTARFVFSIRNDTFSGAFCNSASTNMSDNKKCNSDTLLPLFESTAPDDTLEKKREFSKA